MLPASFLGAVHRHGLNQALLTRMLEDALSAYRRWRKLGFKVPVSVNLPTRLLDNPLLPDELYNTVAASGVPAEDVTFELLEDETTSVPGQYYMGASRLRLKGFGLAQDDFGKGYSSMYTLISTPFTELKIDRAFVSGAATTAFAPPRCCLPCSWDGNWACKSPPRASKPQATWNTCAR